MAALGRPASLKPARAKKAKRGFLGPRCLPALPRQTPLCRRTELPCKNDFQFHGGCFGKQVPPRSQRRALRTAQDVSLRVLVPSEQHVRLGQPLLYLQRRLRQVVPLQQRTGQRARRARVLLRPAERRARAHTDHDDPLAVLHPPCVHGPRVVHHHLQPAGHEAAGPHPRRAQVSMDVHSR
ncbi:hypothetical protein NPIL_72141 [Nephila pilipes]|uniref:Uncharacterized protein n=1 Tax=Nephila pilipes TaxID=299642 RepID=A0A8X6NHE9_NEPPI|nr:hypothetical protein NPIL_72141 [Nephila pilipes]